MAIQISTDTELSAVNSILGSIGQAPITSLTGNALQNPEISFVKNILDELDRYRKRDKINQNYIPAIQLTKPPYMI